MAVDCHGGRRRKKGEVAEGRKEERKKRRKERGRRTNHEGRSVNGRKKNA